MNYDWLDDYLKSKPHTQKDFKVEWGATRYMVAQKMFAMIGENKEKQDIISLKIEPSYGAFLIQTYDDIHPGYYLNKMHWISITLGKNTNIKLIKELIDQSHQIILKSLPKKIINDLSL